MSKLQQPVVLHCHSKESFLDGLSSISEMVQRAKELGMDSLALTNHGNIFGVPNFYQECIKQKIKPILGMEAYLTPNHADKERHAYHLVLLAKNQTGWNNIVKLTTAANKNFYFKPRVDFADLENNAEGIIVLTACMHGPISYQLYDKMTWPQAGEESQLKEAANIPKAYEYARRLYKIFRENLYLEVQDGGIPEQKLINTRVRELAQELNIKTVATQDFHYVNKEDAKAHGFLKSIAFGVKTAVEEGSHGFSTDEFYIKSRDEWLTNSSLLPEEVDRTREIAEQCNVTLEFGKMRLPKYDIGNYESSIALLKEKLRIGWERRSIPKDKDYNDRILKELADIELAGLADYFLIVSDVTDYCREHNIMLGPSRGSAGGSLTSYLLGITNIDPIKYGLIWERFYNAGRAGSMPDIDTDIEKEKREEVINYIQKRFGENRAAQIVTLSSLGAKQVLRDVFKVAGIDENTKNIITGLVPAKNDDHGTISLEEAINSVPELKRYADNEDVIQIERNGKIIRNTSWKELFDIAKRLEGCYKTAGVHAAGVVIADDDFENAGIPLVKGTTKDNLICGWDMKTVDSFGFMKLDVLGLATLDILKCSIQLIKDRHKVSIDLNTINLLDSKVYSLLESGHTQGIFQLESNLGKVWSKKCKPTSVEEIAELIAIIRPACLDTGMADNYVKIKNGEIAPVYIHELLRPILEPTKGILLYQEQVMEICQKIAGMNLKEADSVRKTIGKKKPEELRAKKEQFINGALQTVSQEVAEEIWSWIEKQAGYGFNKSHAIGYGLLSYWTAWIKANYFIEFMCAHLMFAKDKANQNRTPQEVIAQIVNDGKLFNIDVTPPQLHKSNNDFTIINDSTISFGFSHIKGVGAASIDAINHAKSASSFEHFLLLAAEYKIKSDVMEALIVSGALDTFNIPRRVMKARYNLLSSLTDREKDMLSKFNGTLIEKLEALIDKSTIDDRKKQKIKMPNVNRRSAIRDIIDQYNGESRIDTVAQILTWEKHYLGTTLSGSMADLNRVMSGARHNCRQVASGNVPRNAYIELCVVIEDIRETTVKRGKTQGRQMAFISLSDSSYTLEGSCAFPDLYDKIKSSGIAVGDVVSVTGKLSDRGLVINNMRQL